jgi:hypothetical protein
MKQHRAIKPNANSSTEKSTMNIPWMCSDETSPNSYPHVTKVAIGVMHLLVMLALGMALLLAAGCGPGTGGTGVGPVVSLSPASISYTGSANLSVPAPVGGSAAPTLAPAAPADATSTLVTCTNNCATGALLLDITSEQTVLSSACFIFTSQAPLIASFAEDIQLPGTYLKIGTPIGQNPISSQSAILILKFSGAQIGSNSVSVSLKDTADKVLLAPATLTRSDAATPTAVPSTFPATGTTNAITLPPDCSR